MCTLCAHGICVFSYKQYHRALSVLTKVLICYYCRILCQLLCQKNGVCWTDDQNVVLTEKCYIAYRTNVPLWRVTFTKFLLCFWRIIRQVICMRKWVTLSLSFFLHTHTHTQNELNYNFHEFNRAYLNQRQSGRTCVCWPLRWLESSLQSVLVINAMSQLTIPHIQE